ncbi:hypothetical protein LTS06_012336, partial [Exophiala xenobiotica]
MQKAFDAAERASTESSLLRDRGPELVFLQNCEKRLRQSTKSKVVGSRTARVVTYWDILEKRSTQETIKTPEPGSDAGRRVPS